jgi:hypothetical protein
MSPQNPPEPSRGSGYAYAARNLQYETAAGIRKRQDDNALRKPNHTLPDVGAIGTSQRFPPLDLESTCDIHQRARATQLRIFRPEPHRVWERQNKQDVPLRFPLRYSAPLYRPVGAGVCERVVS